MEEFDVEKWRTENPMDYLKAMNIIVASKNKNEVFRWIYDVTRLHIPNVLYKFYSFTDDSSLNDLKIQTLRNQQIYMSEADALNDPYDSRAYFYRPEVLIRHERLQRWGGRIVDDFAAYTRIASLTMCGIQSMPMWAHYTANHKGFCVSYDMKSKKNTNLSSSTFPVQYISKRIDVTNIMDWQAEKLINAIESSIKAGKQIIEYDDLTRLFMQVFFVNIKHASWSYEHEYRSVVDRDTKYVFAAPKEIYIGARCIPSHRKSLLDIAQDLKVPIYQMEYNEFSPDFSLLTKEIGG